MAFTGTASIQLIADGIARITGISLAAGANGTIGLSQSVNSPSITLPGDFHATTYAVPYPAANTSVQTQASIDVTAKAADTTTPNGADVRVTKSGVGLTDFLATVTNANAASATPSLEIYVKFHT